MGDYGRWEFIGDIKAAKAEEDARQSKVDALLSKPKDVTTAPTEPVTLPESTPIGLARHLYARNTSDSAVRLDDKLEAGLMAPIVDGESQTVSKWGKNDGRLYSDFPLYCEGMFKPTCRGALHMICTFLLPVGGWHLINQANGNFSGELCAIIYITSNIWCYGASALYHVGKWSPRWEILFQKLDHTGIAVMSVGTFIPTAVLLFPEWEAVLFVSVLLTACAWCVHGIVLNNPSLARQAIVPSVSLLFLPKLLFTYNRLELICYFLTIFVKVIGMAVFVKQRPDPWPSVFGYHEVWHLFVVIGGILIYIANWSIILRTCDPYGHHNDVSAILMRLISHD